MDESLKKRSYISAKILSYRSCIPRVYFSPKEFGCYTGFQIHSSEKARAKTSITGEERATMTGCDTRRINTAATADIS